MRSFVNVTVTMVQTVHTSSYGETENTPIYAGEAAGYVFDFVDDHTVYHSGDTALMYDMKLIQDVYQPDIAILSSSGQLTMGPKEAAYAVKNLLNVNYVIPSHTFPSKKTATSPEVLAKLLEAFPVVETMIDKDIDLKELLADYQETKVIMLGFREEVEL
ncbi:MBL fold metallo-hydrolase [Virgibacillus byunsanensis]|uniref:MBL fold metallo-hydrolase n=1 Tax=Virgibacillus byunsanensis TaxID=570945 RepID=A0ABW3LHV0_9BACI